MAISPGARLGPYEVLSLIGVGGMGEVYKARDTRLNRSVAVKLLPADLAERPERRRRFEAEAHAISSLSHPHICTLFDVGEEDGRAFLVMELLDGETLDDRLTRGPLPADEVVRYAVQVADALDHAHRAQIIHRDLKPSNVMITGSGAKLLDFGLARRPVVEPMGAAVSTQSIGGRKLTAEGTILGTLQYMAPEQLEGKEADARTDIFAFGALVYEMATGRRAFEGTSQASLIAAILTADPQPISATLPAGDERRRIPAALDHLVERCLAKSPEERWQTARDVKLELDYIAKAGGQTPATVRLPVPRRRWREAAAWAVAAVAAAFAVVGPVVGRRDATPEIVRFVTAPPAGTVLGFAEVRGLFAVSPDGRQLAFVASTGGRYQLWVRSLESINARPLDGTDGATAPFWSPDSRFVGFFSPGTGQLRKVPVSGGPARTICAANQEGQSTWGPDGTILFTQLGEGIFSVSGDGGTPAPVTQLNKAARERNHYWPSFLPDGRRFLYMATALDANGLRVTPTTYAASLDSTAVTPLAQMHSKMVYAPPGYLLYVQDGALFAQRFDAANLRMSGEPARIADRVSYYRTIGAAHFGVSHNGVLAAQGPGDPFRFVWYDRRGNATDAGWVAQAYGLMKISPNGQRVAVDVVDPQTGTGDIWIYEVSGGAPVRFTSDLNNEGVGAWSPDGQRMLFRSERYGVPGLFTKTFGGAEEPLTDISALGSAPQNPNDWSRDGRWIAYVRNTRASLRDVWLLPVGGDRKPRPFADTRFDEYDATFSPDSSWIAFVSDESGTPEVYVAPVGQPGDKRPISAGGGTTPRWRQDGRELFYASAGNRAIMVVPVELGTAMKVGTPAPLFSLGTEYASRGSPRNNAFDVSPDGQRFLVSVPADEPTSSRITVVLNWTTGLVR